MKLHTEFYTFTIEYIFFVNLCTTKHEKSIIELEKQLASYPISQIMIITCISPSSYPNMQSFLFSFLHVILYYINTYLHICIYYCLNTTYITLYYFYLHNWKSNQVDKIGNPTKQISIIKEEVFNVNVPPSLSFSCLCLLSLHFHSYISNVQISSYLHKRGC